MILSMTGFSSETLLFNLPNNHETNIYCTLTLKTLNSRFFEVNCKLPFSLSHIETELIKIFKSKLIRGSVHFTLNMANSGELSSKIEPSLSIIKEYINSINKIKKTYNISGQIDLNNLLNLPNIFLVQENLLDKKFTEKIIKSVQELTDQLNITRLKEGQAICKDLKLRIKNIKSYIKKLEPRTKIVMEERKKQLFENLKKIMQEQNQEANLESQNILLNNQLDKIDVHEEIIRFNTHIKNLEDILESKTEENGKKIDFTLQELFREINTLSSKIPDKIITNLVINIKVELEKSRELSQNIV